MSVTLLDVLVDIPDPRRAEGKRHPLPQVLLFCILGNLCGAHSYKRMAAFIRKHFPVLKAHFPCNMKAPISKSQLRDLLARLCPEGFEAAFRIHAAALEADGLVGKGIDEKTTAVGVVQNVPIPVTSEIDRALMVKGFLVLDATLI